MQSDELEKLPRKKQKLYAGYVARPEDLSLIFDNADRFLADILGDFVLNYLYERAQCPWVSRDAWKAEARRSTAIEVLLRDFCGAELSPVIEQMFDPIVREKAFERLASPRGVLVLGFQGGFTTLQRQLFSAFVTDGLIFRIEEGPGHSGEPDAALSGAMRALGDGRAVYFEPDRPLGDAEDEVEVVGAKCPIAAAAARLAYEANCATVWFSVRREGRTFTPVVEPGPSREPDESFPVFKDRLLDFYGRMIEQVLTGDPQSIAIRGQWRRLITAAADENIQSGILKRLSPPKRQFYAERLVRPDDLSLIFENADRILDKTVTPPALDYLYAHTRCPWIPRDVWDVEVRRATAIELLMKDLCTVDLPRAFEPMFDSAAMAEALGRMASPRGALILTIHSGFTMLLRQLFFAFIPDGVMIQAHKASARTLGAKRDAAGALFAAMRLLNEGRPVYIAADGPFGKAGPEVEVLGTRNPIASGASFLAHETRCATFWFSMSRDGRKFSPVVEPGPSREAGESYPDFTKRLLGFYGRMIEQLFTGDPQSIAIYGQWRKLMQAAQEAETLSQRAG